MSIEEIVKAWKADEETGTTDIPANPVGEELSDEDLREVTGGVRCAVSCIDVSCVGGGTLIPG